MSFRKSAYVCLLCAMVFLGTASWAQDQGREFHWKGQLAADKLLTIKNVNGDIDAMAADTPDIEVSAEKSGRGADQVRIEVFPNNDGVAICAIYPGSSGDCGEGQHYHSEHGPGVDAKVHFTVRMPKNLRFAADNVNGNIVAADMGRSVNANDVNGNVNVSTMSWAEAQTVNGRIKASMGNAGWQGTLQITSVNGSIELDLPGDLSAEVNFSSVNGKMQTDFPLTITNSWPVGHSANGVIGKGGRQLALKTVNGNVELRKGSAGL